MPSTNMVESNAGSGAAFGLPRAEHADRDGDHRVDAGGERRREPCDEDQAERAEVAAALKRLGERLR